MIRTQFHHLGILVEIDFDTVGNVHHVWVAGGKESIHCHVSVVM